MYILSHSPNAELIWIHITRLPRQGVHSDSHVLGNAGTVLLGVCCKLCVTKPVCIPPHWSGRVGPPMETWNWILKAAPFHFFRLLHPELRIWSWWELDSPPRSVVSKLVPLYVYLGLNFSYRHQCLVGSVFWAWFLNSERKEVTFTWQGEWF